MLFNSYSFLFFFPIVLLVLFILPAGRVRRIWLLLCSLFFYACWNVRHLFLLAASILITYACGLLMGRISDRRKQKLVMAGGLVLDFGILFFFKYYGFFIDTINSVLSHFGQFTVTDRLDVLLPVGISFYTFQAVGYTIDVYRGDIKPEKDLVKYALFVSFFPQLVAGPIERSKNMFSQIDALGDKKIFDYERIRSGFIYLFWGLFLKMVIADRISVLVDEVFDRYYTYGTLILITGAAAFAIQIYCDFASYSIIAAGSAEMLGFSLMENFDTPYFAMSVRDFWRRWHISLSTWFRDYLYFPLGGGRCSTIKKYRNILITFLVSGLWHGADWSFVIWGGLHGVFQVAGDVLTPLRSRIRTALCADENSFGYRLGRIIGTFILTDFAWIFFRAKTAGDAFSYIQRMLTRFDPWVLTDGSIYTLGLDMKEMHILLASLLVLFAVSLLKYRRHIRPDAFLCRQGTVFRVLVVYALIMSIIIFGKYGPSEAMKAFIYFQF